VIDGDRHDPGKRVLFLAPTAKDAALTSSILHRAGVACESCLDLAEICDKLDDGASVVILPEEAVVPEQYGRLVRWLSRQPAWSDLPLLVLARPGADSATVAQAMDRLGNVTVLERPTRVSSLVSAVRTALRARQRQYQIREYLAEHVRSEAALRDADRRKDEFLAILAHELRNPLAPIRNSLHVLRLENATSQTTQRVAEIMERQVNHMVRLVDDLLEVSRISRGKIELRKELLDVSAVVRSAVETSRPLIEANQQKLQLDLPTEPLYVEGDFVRLTQIVANLLNNAAKYSDPGGEIRLAVKSEADHAAISVNDDGMGIPADELPRVFDLFMQVERQPNRVHGGLGIGLTLVKSLIELHGGTVNARSGGAGQGSEFVVRLPLAGASDSKRAALDPAGAGAVLTAGRVLVVDDNRDAADSLSTLLRLLGAEVRVVYDGADAFNALANYRPNVVLLDIGMPGMDGHEVARQIRRLPHGREVTLVALTGWGQEEDRQRSRAAGFDFHLVKPASLEALRELLASSDRRVETVSE